MKTKINHIALFTFFCLFLAGPIMAQNKKDIEQKVQEMKQKMKQNMLDGVFTTEYHAEDAISMPNNFPMVEGIEAIKASNAQMEKMGFSFDKVEFVTKKIMVNGNMVTEIGTYDMTMSMANVPEPMIDKGKYITIWEVMKDGSLKIKVETWNTDMPPMGMN